MADSGVPPETSEASDVAEEEIPTNLPSDVGMDYIPLATMLATGQLAEADQVRLLCDEACGLLGHSSPILFHLFVHLHMKILTIYFFYHSLLVTP